MSKYEKKEPSERQVMEGKLNVIEQRLNALQKKIDSSPLNELELLIQLRTRLQYKREAYKSRLSKSTKNADIMDYNITIVLWSIT